MQTKRGTDGGVSHVPGPAGGTEGEEWPGRRRSFPARRVAAITAALAGVACVAAACSTPKNPAGNSSPSDPGAQALAYSQCMRSHGVPDFPDPKVSSNSGGTGVSMGVGTRGDLNPSKPAFKAASQACRSLQPGEDNPPAQSAQELATDVKFADCMRSHGYPGFPDPDPKGVFNLPSTINPNSAQFGSATSACQSKTNIHSLNMSQNGNGGGS
jgi:hypothetical protein